MPIVLVVVLVIVAAALLIGPTLSLLWTLLIGFIAGALAKFLMPGRDGGGFLMTALLGIGGSFIASILGRVLGIYTAGSSVGFIASVVGAVIILAAYRVFTGARSAA